MVHKHGGTKDKSIFDRGAVRRPSTLEKRFLTTITPDLSLSYDWFYWLVSKPGYLVLENSYNEFDAYCIIAECYKNDKEYKTLFQKLKIAMDERRIKPEHAGGCSSLVDIKNYIHRPSGEGSKYLNLKTVLLFDRDTNSNVDQNGKQCYDPKKEKLLFHCCGKGLNDVNSSDIYTFHQPNGAWHMWYKRAIENYFDDQAYRDCGMGEINLGGLHRDYVNIGKDGNPRGYKKSELSNLASKMSRDRFEKGLKHFYCPSPKDPSIEESFSEMQLFLLKLVRIM